MPDLQTISMSLLFYLNTIKSSVKDFERQRLTDHFQVIISQEVEALVSSLSNLQQVSP